jgi:hypothetical protein
VTQTVSLSVRHREVDCLEDGSVLEVLQGKTEGTASLCFSVGKHTTPSLEIAKLDLMRSAMEGNLELSTVWSLREDKREGHVLLTLPDVNGSVLKPITRTLRVDNLLDALLYVVDGMGGDCSQDKTIAAK